MAGGEYWPLKWRKNTDRVKAARLRKEANLRRCVAMVKSRLEESLEAALDAGVTEISTFEQLASGVMRGLENSRAIHSWLLTVNGWTIFIDLQPTAAVMIPPVRLKINLAIQKVIYEGDSSQKTDV